MRKSWLELWQLKNCCFMPPCWCVRSPRGCQDCVSSWHVWGNDQGGRTPDVSGLHERWEGKQQTLWRFGRAWASVWAGKWEAIGHDQAPLPGRNHSVSACKAENTQVYYDLVDKSVVFCLWLDHFFHCSNFKLIQMDTDSNYVYIAIYAEQVEDIVHPELCSN